ncbi:hypothetical protein A9Q90_04720 [Gammaproteobacteria bacterium 54_18_T64]|nr:hypothetical protein A9Q90_04720 [Gammaproteobacteria bacterium 54_18_T64]
MGVLFVLMTAISVVAVPAEKPGTPLVQTKWERDFLLANLEFTLLHEFGHLLIEELKLPVLGMEEDAVDRLAMIVMMREHEHKPSADFIPWLLSVAGRWYIEWELKAGPQEKVVYWDNHNLEIQRFHNIVCLVFGGNSDLLDDLSDTEFLPFERSVNCDYEYKQALHAMAWLQRHYGHKSATDPRVNTVKVIYKNPRIGQNRAIFELLQSSPMVGKWAQRLSDGFKFPRPIRIEFDNCYGQPDAYWHAPTASVTICYELLGHFMEMLEYRRQHSSKACGIPILRKHMGNVMSCT